MHTISRPPGRLTALLRPGFREGPPGKERGNGWEREEQRGGEDSGEWDKGDENIREGKEGGDAPWAQGEGAWGGRRPRGGCFHPSRRMEGPGVKIEKNLLWTAYRNSPLTLYRTVPSTYPDGLPLCGHSQGPLQFLCTPY